MDVDETWDTKQNVARVAGWDIPKYGSPQWNRMKEEISVFTNFAEIDVGKNGGKNFQAEWASNEQRQGRDKEEQTVMTQIAKTLRTFAKDVLDKKIRYAGERASDYFRRQVKEV